MSSLTFAYCQRRTPIVLQDIQADRPARVNVRMVDGRFECDFRGLKGVLRGEVDIHVEHPSGVGTIGLQA